MLQLQLLILQSTIFSGNLIQVTNVLSFDSAVATEIKLGKEQQNNYLT